jgi:hypothetical protein
MQLLVVFLMLILNLFINAIYWEHRGTNKLRLKMKTFRLIGMALLAVVMCVNFASCSSDEDLPNAKGAILVLGGNTPIEYSDFQKVPNEISSIISQKEKKLFFNIIGETRIENLL